MSHGSVRVKLIAEDAFKGKAFVAGYHGIGFVGFLAVKHMVKALRGRKIGYVVSPYMPQVVNASAEGIAAPYELYDVGSAVVFLPNAPLTRHDLLRVPYALAEASLGGGASMALLIGGLDASYRKGDGRALRYAATNAFLNRYGRFVEGEYPLEEGLAIVGPLAAMLAYYEAHGFPAVAVLPYADPTSADPLAAKVAVEYAARVLGVPIGTEELVKLAEEKAKLEKELEEIRRKAAQEEGRMAKLPQFYV